MKIERFDADELQLSKKYVIGILILIERRWKSTGTDTKFIMGLKAFRIALKFTPEPIFKTFWKQVLEFLNMLMYENGKAQAKSRGESWVNVLELIPTKIEQGNFDLDKNALDKDDKND
ncbi:MAG TPA: hypothetical protein VLE02_02765 [Nitrosarchaeum sp.]|nr:hypothetical protein [Nitrosarchaeum sp.]